MFDQYEDGETLIDAAREAGLCEVVAMLSRGFILSEG